MKNEIDKKFDEWFKTADIDTRTTWGIARMAYEQALIDVWELPILDVCAVAEKHGKVVKANGSVGDLIKNGHTAAEFFADPDGYDEYDLKTVVVRPDPRPHCCYHPRYHGLRPPQHRKSDPWDHQGCEECENIYKQVQEEKRRKREAGTL